MVLRWLTQMVTKAGGALPMWHLGIFLALASLALGLGHLPLSQDAPVAPGRDVSRHFVLHLFVETFAAVFWLTVFKLLLLDEFFFVRAFVVEATLLIIVGVAVSLTGAQAMALDDPLGHSVGSSIDRSERGLCGCGDFKE